MATSNEAELLAACREEPNLFAAYVLEFEQARIHAQMQSHLHKYPNCYIEFPRGHGKTSQMVLRVAWEIGRDPSLRVKYVQQSDMEARKTTGLIKSVVESEAYNRVFPEVEPDHEMWGKSEFKLKAGKWQRDATVEAKSIFGRAGGRADILIADDICDMRNAIQQSALREQVKDFWASNWLPMRDFTRPETPKTWKVGTCYHADDITADWRRHHDDGSLLRLPVVGFRSPWPERIHDEYLKDIRSEVGPFAYARAYELEPITSELLIFNPDWLRDGLYDEMPEWERENGMMVASIDFAFTEKKQSDDPDWSVCLIGWKSHLNNIWLRELVRQRSSFPDFARVATARMAEAGVDQAVAEANGPQVGLVQQMQKDCPVPIRPLNRTIDKITRASERQGYVESGKFHMPLDTSLGDRQVRQDFRVMWDELTTFPVGGHDDTVDAAIDLMEFAVNFGAPLSPGRITAGGDNPLDRLYGKKEKGRDPIPRTRPT